MFFFTKTIKPFTEEWRRQADFDYLFDSFELFRGFESIRALRGFKWRPIVCNGELYEAVIRVRHLALDLRPWDIDDNRPRWCCCRYEVRAASMRYRLQIWGTGCKNEVRAARRRYGLQEWGTGWRHQVRAADMRYDLQVWDTINQSINISFIQKGTLQRTSKYSYSYTWPRLIC